jgi:lipid II:glycine glycyltransferase (peptidoglycan interpeptide bridge formation enzyme)
MPELSTVEWEKFLVDHPSAHIMQTSGWGELKATFGWQVFRLAVGNGVKPSGEQACYTAGAQVLLRRIPFGFSLAYIPKGPVGVSWEGLWSEIDALCLRERAVFLKIEPDLWEEEAHSQFRGAFPPGFHLSSHTIQPPRTMIVDLRSSEADILSLMKQKTRYNIRLALKKGVIVHPFEDVDLFCQLMQQTGKRDRFGVHSPAYYQKVYDVFHSRDECEMFLAEYERQPLAALMVFARGDRAWYFYGASADTHRERMPSYILQWEAMRWAKQRGCLEYDLWGVPDADENSLETNFTSRSDGLWGVYRFKRGFNGELRRSAGPWDRVYSPLLYRLYRFLTRERGEAG